MDDELQEDDNLVLAGETAPEDYDSDDEAGAPIRLLNDFTVYDMSSNKVVPIEQLLELSLNENFNTITFGASGIARPWIDDFDEDDAEDSDTDLDPLAQKGQRIKLSKILEFDTHHYSSETKKLDRFI